MYSLDPNPDLSKGTYILTPFDCGPTKLIPLLKKKKVTLISLAVLSSKTTLGYQGTTLGEFIPPTNTARSGSSYFILYGMFLFEYNALK